MERIIVGTDGSPQATRAVTWAAREAEAHDATLVIVHTFNPIDMAELFPTIEAMSSTQVDVVREKMEESRTHAKDLVDRAAAEVGSDHPGVTVEALAVDSARPAASLVEQASDADLLVVGSRGRGGFAGLLLGSVSQQCATHATCPVVIVR